MKVDELDGVMTKDEVLGKLHSYEEAQPEEIELDDNIAFTSAYDGTEVEVVMKHRKGEVILTPVALGVLMANIGFPRPYLKKVPAEQYSSLVLPHLDYWYGEVFAGNVMRLFVIDNSAIMVVPKANFQHVPISEVIQATERQLGKTIGGYHKLQMHEGTISFSVITPKEVEVRKNDIFNEGIRIQHSLTGATSSKVSAYLFRQWCSNGATTEDQIDSWSRRSNSGDDFSIWLQKSIMAADKSFGQEITRVRALQEIPTSEHTAEILNSVLDSSSVPQKLQKEVRSILVDRGAETLYDIYNVLTEVDTHTKYSDDHPLSAGLLDKVACHLTHHSELCPVCHKQIDGKY